MGRHRKARKGTTTIMVSTETKQILDRLKDKKESYDEFLARLLKPWITLKI